MSCPRCRGIMVDASDEYGECASCLSCGYVDETIILTSMLINDLDIEAGQVKGVREHYAAYAMTEIAS